MVKFISPEQYPALNNNREKIRDAIIELNSIYGIGDVTEIDFAWCTFRCQPFSMKPFDRGFALKWNWKKETCTVVAHQRQRTFKYELPDVEQLG